MNMPNANLSCHPQVFAWSLTQQRSSLSLYNFILRSLVGS
ncbi:Protein of unknown function [Pyronema omphalodes CBS 100304]|uniref:Uncharacterized protein n=1 Tax=Pyronema omphalodes (strain CBS 100304) TaxID=1076935 RepID=U4L9F1_PYROM|nr:Protein of unknown function [Pyronema omphalodes CBS 100304]